MTSPKICKDCKSEGITTGRPAPFPGPRCATHHRQFTRQRKQNNHDRYVETTYGITGVDYQRLLEVQNGLCAICGPVSGRRGASRRLSVDHNHATGEVRGLLCMTCNDYLGLIKDDPNILLRAAHYLISPPARILGT